MAEHAGIKVPRKISLADAQSKAVELGVKVDRGDLVHKILDNIYKKTCRPKLIQPTFIVDYPTAFSPLAKHKPGTNGEMIDRFQLVVGGYELVNAFFRIERSIEQYNRFIAQRKNKAQGDVEAQPTDDAYVEAMEHGMPPAGGSAISIDRLTMILTNTKILEK